MVPVLNLGCSTDRAVGLSVFRRSPSRPVPEWYVEIGHDSFIRIFRHRNRFSRCEAAKLYLRPMSLFPPVRRSEGITTLQIGSDFRYTGPSYVRVVL